MGVCYFLQIADFDIILFRAVKLSSSSFLCEKDIDRDSLAYLVSSDNGCESRMVRGCFRKELCPWYGFSNSHYANLFPSPVGFTLMHYRHEELTAATDGFSDSNLLGEGGFGFVHKGILPTGKQVAVKQLKTGSRQGDKEFQAELETISRVHHKHLVSLVGFCISGKKRFLVYEFLPNNTLEFHLHGEFQLNLS